jgi:hypothetical protein
VSAIEWLHFINSFVVIIISIALVACVPVQLTKEPKPIAWKKTSIVTFGVIALGWVLAWIAPHIMTPIVRVNVTATSQLILSVTLFLLSLITLVRIFHRNNALSWCMIFLKNHFPLFAKVFGFFAAAIGALFVDSLDDKSFSKRQTNNRTLSDEEKVLRTMKTNYQGDYCDDDKLNWH